MVTGDVAGRLPPQSLQRWAGSSGTWEGGRVWLRTASDCAGPCASARDSHKGSWSQRQDFNVHYALGKTTPRKQVELNILTSGDSHSETWCEPQPWEAVGQGPSSRHNSVRSARACVRDGRAPQDTRETGTIIYSCGLHRGTGAPRLTRSSLELWIKRQNYYKAKETCPEQGPFSLSLNLQVIRNSRGDPGEERAHLGGWPLLGLRPQNGTGGRRVALARPLRSGATTILKGCPLGPLARSKELQRLQELTTHQI